MKRNAVALMAGLAVAGALLAAPAMGEGPLRERLKARMAERMAEGEAGARSLPGASELSYGVDPLQKLDFWKAKRARAPLVLFVHGGGWKRGDKGNATGQDKVRNWLAQGYAVASINYRLVPEHRVEDQAADVASAVAYLRGRAGELGIDPARIALVGHSAGAHLSGLVGTDTGYFARAGVPLSAIAAIVLLDGAAYDVPAQMKDGPQVMHATYAQAFGENAARQKALSPTWQAGAPNAADFLILHVEREDGERQANTLAAALTKAGAQARVEKFEGRGLKGHARINRMLGSPDHPATAVVDAYLAARLGAAR